MSNILIPGRENSFIGIGLDPGVRNFAVSVMELEFMGSLAIGSAGNVRTGIDTVPQGMYVQVIKSGILKHPMNDINKIVPQTKNFLEEMSKIIDKYQPAFVCAERFQNRGFIAGGARIELVNIMLGALATLPQFAYTQLKLVSPIVWKSAAKRQFDLKAYYKKCRMPVHEFDASMIGLYGAHFHTKRKAYVNTVLDPDDLIRQLELSSMSKLKRPKKIKRDE